MKKIFLTFLIVFMFCSCSYGAVSEDMSIYVRKDLFEVYMQNVNSNFEKVFARLDKIDSTLENINQSIAGLNTRITKLETRMDGLEKRIENISVSISQRIDGLEKRIEDVNASMSQRMDGLEKRIDDVKVGLEARMVDLRDDVKARMGDLSNSIYLWSVILGLVVGLPFLKSMYDESKENKKQARAPSLTVEDVEKLFERLLLEAKAKGAI